MARVVRDSWPLGAALTLSHTGSLMYDTENAEIQWSRYSQTFGNVGEHLRNATTLPNPVGCPRLVSEAESAWPRDHAHLNKRTATPIGAGQTRSTQCFGLSRLTVFPTPKEKQNI
jgi:hypothetical protein